jgi:hypothetical protein
LVVTPGQFFATSQPNDPKTVGKLRLYNELNLEVYSASLAELDFVAPSIWEVSALPGANKSVTFRALVSDEPDLSGTATKWRRPCGRALSQLVQ